MSFLWASEQTLSRREDAIEGCIQTLWNTPVGVTEDVLSTHGLRDLKDEALLKTRRPSLAREILVTIKSKVPLKLMLDHLWQVELRKRCVKSSQTV